ncbi:hypothetical protein [Pseudalkalibacillus caeni]|uniref:Uncharacterized protein n=1 Tax=Exobacillus caeni TaxID=2574798 RepID=A0A5R9F206_9BACL|nr:hypothetical protein [Pseudalkalibacillus caeni]TLS37091.1 hypothetical protein FCL54_11220 [Pseudalkalibacillus caeni]
MEHNLTQIVILFITCIVVLELVKWKYKDHVKRKVLYFYGASWYTIMITAGGALISIDSIVFTLIFVLVAIGFHSDQKEREAKKKTRQ